MAINGGIFGGFTGGLFNNNLGFSPSLLPGQSVPFNPAFNPTPLLNAFFQPFPWAANSLVTSNQIALAGGGPPLIASYPTVSPFPNAFLNQFNPALAAGLGGLVPNALGGAGGGLVGAQSLGLGGGALGGLQGMGLQGMGLGNLGLGGILG